MAFSSKSYNSYRMYLQLNYYAIHRILNTYLIVVIRNSFIARKHFLAFDNE